MVVLESERDGVQVRIVGHGWEMLLPVGVSPTLGLSRAAAAASRGLHSSPRRQCLHDIEVVVLLVAQTARGLI